jgi:hypothetical protein
MTAHGGQAPAPFTVEDLWTLRSDSGSAGGRTGVVGRAQTALGQVLDRLDVPTSWHHGRLTFFPHDEGDVAAINTAMRAAIVIRAEVARVRTAAR